MPRAWVFQEQALSGRTIAYGVEGIHWSCYSGERSESGPHYPRRTWHTDANRFPWFQERLIEADGRGASRPVAAASTVGLVEKRAYKRPDYDGWHNMVQGYSARSLTYDAGKLTAISAVDWQRDRTRVAR